MIQQQMNSIKRIYYKIWIDAIKAAIKTDKDGQNSWKTILLITFSVSQGINLLMMFLLLKIFFNLDMSIFMRFDIFPGRMLDGFLSAFILFFPFLLLNYFLVFYRGKYKTLMNQFNGFRMKEGLAFMLYFFTSMLLFILPVIIGKALS
jgi:hypothetical protein